MVASPRCSWVSTTAAPKRARAASSMAAPCMPLVPLHARGDLVLQLHEAVERRFGARRTAGAIHVHRDDRVDALHGGVVVVEPARARAHAEGHHPLRLGHLVVDALED